VALEGRSITQIVVPFGDHPDLFSCAEFGAPVVTGEGFSARVDDGSTINL